MEFQHHMTAFRGHSVPEKRKVNGAEWWNHFLRRVIRRLAFAYSSYASKVRICRVTTSPVKAREQTRWRVNLISLSIYFSLYQSSFIPVASRGFPKGERKQRFNGIYIANLHKGLRIRPSGAGTMAEPLIGPLSKSRIKQSTKGLRSHLYAFVIRTSSVFTNSLIYIQFLSRINIPCDLIQIFPASVAIKNTIG